MKDEYTFLVRFYRSLSDDAGVLGKEPGTCTDMDLIPQAVVNAVNVINNRTKWANARTKDDRRYQKQRHKVTLPSQYDVWLKKEV